MKVAPEPTASERWLARTLGDDLPRNPGSGWISGVVGVFLGAIALGAVVVLHFPDLLTSADLRARHPLPVMRALIQLTIGSAEPALYAWLVIIALHGVLNHVNMRFRLGLLERVLVTPRFHHWHHAVSPPDRNFAVHFPWLDRLFGTHYLPDSRWPEELGIQGHPAPSGFAGQLVYPLRRS